MKGKVIYALYGLLFLGIAIWIYQEWASEERRLLRRLGELQELIEKDGGENDLVAANKARQLGELFTEDFTIHLTPIGETLTDRQRLMQVALQYRRQHSRVGLGFSDRELTLGVQKRRGELLTVASLTATRDGSPSRGRYRLRFEWQKQDGVWRIHTLEVLEQLEGSLFF